MELLDTIDIGRLWRHSQGWGMKKLVAVSAQLPVVRILKHPIPMWHHLRYILPDVPVFSHLAVFQSEDINH